MKTLKLFLLLTLPVVVLSCSNGTNNNRNNNRNQNKPNNQTNPSGSKDTISRGSLMFSLIPRVQDDNDKDFLNEAAVGGLMEVQAGKIAVEKATNQRVKNFGAMMVKDHTKGNGELKVLASSKKIDVPSALDDKHQRKVDELNGTTKDNFDKTYIKQMVEDHQEDVDLFKKQSGSAKDPAIKAFASKTLPMLTMHLDSAKAIQRDLK